MADKLSFKQRLLGLQGNLYNFACQLTSDRDAAQDLVQDTTLKVLDNEKNMSTMSTSRVGCSRSCATSSSTIIAVR